MLKTTQLAQDTSTCMQQEWECFHSDNVSYYGQSGLTLFQGNILHLSLK